MKRKFFAVILVMILILSICGCSKGTENSTTTLPEKHTVAYDENMESVGDDMGADSFDGYLDSNDSEYYNVKDFYNMKSDDNLHIISNFETYQQTTEYTCACACAVMVLHHFGIDSYNELELADIAGTNETTGTSVEGMCKIFDTAGLKYEYHNSTTPKFQTYEDADKYFIDCVDNNKLVMVDWLDWRGHWQVIIGVDTCGTDEVYDDVLILADPYDVTDSYQDGYYTYSFARFFDMWREGVCAQKEEPYEQPFVTVMNS